MNCCAECFQDVQIRKMIKKNRQMGYCDFCGRENIEIYSVESSSDLSDYISGIINVYEAAGDGEPLFDVLINHWGIFNRELPSVRSLVERFCNITFGDCEHSHNVNVKIPHAYIRDYGIFSGHSWEEFSEAIKTNNRFHNAYLRADQFAPFLSYSITKHRKREQFFRARVWGDGHGYRTAAEMGAPPIGKRRPGHVNPEGIGVLYLTSDEKTALSEVRASAFDLVSVATFYLKKDIEIVNLSGLNNISPVICIDGLEALAANNKVFGDIAKEIAKPLRRNDSALEYLPTQYITEFIKSKGYSGVQFASTMETGGNNIAVFDESLFEFGEVHNVEIKKIEYSYDKLVHS